MYGVLNDKSLSIFNLYPKWMYDYFMKNTNRLKLFSLKREFISFYGQKEIVSVILYSSSLDKLLLLPVCLVGEEGNWQIPYFIKDFFQRLEFLLKKALRRVGPNSMEFFYVPKDLEWLPEKVFHIGRYYLCLNDFPTGIHHLKRYWFAFSKLTNLHQKDISILELGHGMAYFQNRFSSKFKYYAYDIDPEVRLLAEKINLSKSNFLTHPTSYNKYDVIVSFEVIEHVEDPFFFMDNLLSLSSEKTKFFISVPEEEFHGSHLNFEHVTNWNYSRVKTFFSLYFDSLKINNQKVFDFTSKNWFENSEFIDDVLEPEEVESYLVEGASPKKKKRDLFFVKRTGALGDALLMEPVVRALKKKKPDSFVIVSTQYTELYKANPFVDLVAKNGVYGLFTPVVPPADSKVFDLDLFIDPKYSIIKNYVRALGIGIKPAESSPKVYPSKVSYIKILSILESLNLPYIICFNIGKKENKCRTLDLTLSKEIIIKLFESFKIPVFLLGSQVPANYSSLDLDLPGDYCIDLVGRLSISDVAALLSLSNLLIAPDTGLLHLSASVECMSIGIFGMALPEKRIDYTKLVMPVISDLECVGCLHKIVTTDPRCPKVIEDEVPLCMKSFDLDTVVQAALSIVERQTPYKWRELKQLLFGEVALSKSLIFRALNS